MKTNKIYHRESDATAIYYVVLFIFLVPGLFAWNIL